MSLGLLALLVAAAALAVAMVIAASVRRSRREVQGQLASGVLELSGRLDALSRELAAAVEQVREEAVRARVVASLDGTLDLDEVLARCVEAARSFPDVAGAAITVAVDGALQSETSGLAAGVVAPVGGPPGETPVRAVGLSYHYAEGELTPDAMRSAVAVPIVTASDGRIGFLTVYGLREEPPVAGSEFRVLEEIAHHAGPAIERARLRDAGGRPDADELTGLPGRQALHETLAREVARSHRAGAKLALCVFDVDDLATANRRLGVPTGDRLVVEVAERLRDALRPGDLPFRAGGDEFAIVMPASRRIDAESAFARIQASLQRLPHPLAPGASISAGIAELKPDDDGVSLFERADQALRRAKDTGKGTAASQ